MFQLNNTNIFTGYIKELLHSFNLPTIDVYDENRVYNNCYYIKDNEIVFKGESGGLTKIRSYHENDKILLPILMTKQFEIKNNVYDAYTHFTLGKYLRWLKKYHNFNLMQLYNCFCKNIPNLELSFKDTKDEDRIFSSNDTSHIIYMFPVSLFEKYTIAIDCDLPIEITCGYFDNFLMKKESLAIYKRTYLKKAGLKFNNPFIYDKLMSPTNTDDEYINRDKLKMFIKVPVDCSSSIVVLEGDYRNINNYVIHRQISNTEKMCYNKTIVNLEDKQKMIWDSDTTGAYSGVLKTPSQLLKMNDGVTYCFADRLIEYLLGNTIDKLDTISDNVKRIQKSIEDRFPYSSAIRFINDDGIWSDKMKYIVYSYAVNDLVSMDSLGYVDKDVEIKMGKDIDIYNEEDSL